MGQPAIAAFRDLAGNYDQFPLRHSVLFFQQPGFSLPSRAPDDSSKFERGAAMALRHLLFLLAAYVVFHKVFPFALLGSHLVDLTVGDFLRVLLQTLVSIIGAAYLVAKSFRPPNLEFRDRVWCERWIAIAFGVIAHHGRIDGDRFART